MITGIGTDLVSIKRIKEIFYSHGERFVKRILTGSEVEKYSSKSEVEKINYLAKRFAAKEAISKALGTGIGNLSFHDIEIKNLNSGKPTVHVKKFENLRIHLSISDEKDFALAFAIAEK